MNSNNFNLQSISKQPTDENRFYIVMKKSYKDKAVKYGAMYDASLKKWYITKDNTHKRLFAPVEVFIPSQSKADAKKDGCFFDNITNKWYALAMNKDAIDKWKLVLSEDEDSNL